MDLKAWVGDPSLSTSKISGNEGLGACYAAGRDERGLGLALNQETSQNEKVAKDVVSQMN
jgi:hypothetical protein